MKQGDDASAWVDLQDGTGSRRNWRLRSPYGYSRCVLGRMRCVVVVLPAEVCFSSVNQPWVEAPVEMRQGNTQLARLAGATGVRSSCFAGALRQEGGDRRR